MIRQSLILSFVFVVFAFSAVGDEAKKKAVKKPPPQLAGFGMVAVKHTCSVSYEGCLSNCKSATGAGCAEECAADCNVCSLDFGEEAGSVCQK